MRRCAAVSVFIFALTSCQREKRDVRPEPTRVVVYGNAAPQSELQPGEATAAGRESVSWHRLRFERRRASVRLV